MRKILLTTIFVSLAGVLSAQEDSLQIDEFSVEELSDSLDLDFGLELEETVVVGYGTQKRGDLTSAVSSAKAEDIVKQPATTAMQSLQGKLAGVNIINTDQPGAAPSVVIRGMGTAMFGRDPLYIVDGLIVPNIVNINPNDIESIDVMKDAASSAIYGVRGANGVVIITTKRGKSGAARVSYNAYVGFKNILNKIDMADANQYAQYFNEERAANGATTFLNPNQRYNTNWLDEITGTGIVSNNNVTLSGGSENFNYFFGVDHFDEKGLLEGQDFRRTTVRNNNEYKLFDKRVRITQNVSASFTKENIKPMGAFNTAHRQSPVMPVRFDDGKWGVPFWNDQTGQATYIGSTGSLNSHGNPVSAIYHTNDVANTTTLQGFLQVDVDIVDGLTFTSRAGGTKYWNNKETYVPTRDLWLAADPTRTNEDFDGLQTTNPTEAQYANNSFSIEKIETFRWQWENYVTYNKQFGKHSLNAVLGVTGEEVGVGNRLFGRGYNVPYERQYWNINFATAEPNKVIEHINYTPTTYASYFGRVQYDFDDRYYISAVVRRDGTSRFKAYNLYWETFPSFSAGWTISNEEFLKGNEFINFLKIRGGWGRLGNENIDQLNVSTIVRDPGSATQNYVFGPGQDLIFGASFGTPAYPIGWEITEEWGGGVDFALLNNKLSGTFDYYQKLNTNLLMTVPNIRTGPYEGDYIDHGGEVLNEGWEASLNWKDRSASGDFTYEIGVNFNYNENVVQNVKPAYDGMNGGSLGNGRITKRLQEGQPLGAWWLFEVEGVWQSQEEIDNNTHFPGAQPGHLRYVDQNGDGVIDERDKKFFGSYIPKYNYGVHIGIGYKGFDFSIDGYGVGGNKIYNGLNSTRLGGENISLYMFENRWTGEGSTNSHPGAERDVEASNYYLEDGAFFRINNITLGYNFKNIFPAVRNLRLYVTAQNPFIFTKYEGYTPELNGTGENTGNPYRTTGVELDAYPNTRSFLMGVNVEF